MHVTKQQPHNYYLLASIRGITRHVQDFEYKLHTHVDNMTTTMRLGGAPIDPITHTVFGCVVPGGILLPNAVLRHLDPVLVQSGNRVIVLEPK